MITYRMIIEQADNGWVLDYTGHNCLKKRSIHSKWEDVVKEIEEYFGWWDMNGNWLKENPRA